MTRHVPVALCGLNASRHASTPLLRNGCLNHSVLVAVPPFCLLTNDRRRRAGNSGDHIGYTLGINLFRAAMGTERHPSGDAAAERGGEVAAVGGGWAKGGVDCELLVAGSYLHAHRVVLATRSPVLRDMIAQVRM